MKRFLTALLPFGVTSVLVLNGCAAPSAVQTPGIAINPSSGGVASAQMLQKQQQQQRDARSQRVGLPAGRNLTSVDFLSARDGFLAGSTTDSISLTGSYLWKTTDAGKTWLRLRLPAGLSFATVHFTSLQKGFGIRVLQESQTSTAAHVQLWCTNDGGLTWQLRSSALQSPLAAPKQYTITFPSAMTGYALLGNSVLQTTDGGTQWHTVWMPTNKTFPQSIAFATLKRGWMIGEVLAPTSNKKTGTTAETLTVYTTTDGGKRWAAQYTKQSPYPNYQNVSLSFANAHDGWFFYQNTANMSSSLFRTTNGGQTWTDEQPQLFQSRFSPGPIQFISPLVGWVPVDSGAAPFPGLIAITTDGGKTFHNYGNSNTSIYAVDVVSSTEGWAIGQFQGNTNNYLLHTTDGGKSFAQVMPTAYPLSSLQFIGQQTGFGVGDISNPNALVRTDDGGQLWSAVATLPVEFVGNASALSFLNDEKGYFLNMPANSYAPGATPTLYQTDNGGKRWTVEKSLFAKVEKQPTFNGNYLRMWSDGKGIAEVENFPSVIFLRTNDGGHTWKRFAMLAIHSGGITSYAQFASPDQGYLLLARGMQTDLYSVVPGAISLVRTWPGNTEPVALATRTGNLVVALNTHPFSDKPAITVYRSANGAKSWISYTMSDSEGLANSVSSYGSTMSIFDQSVWWLTSNGLLQSSSNGASWFPLG